MFSFRSDIQCPDTHARTGWLGTAHGEIETPVFMPVGTQGTVKAVAPWDLRTLGAKIILGNAYHLYLRPGHERIAQLGGLQEFTGWHGPMLTDSGGFQVFSLAHISSVDDDGVRFRSHIDGSEHHLTPERVMEIEQALGADVAMVLDEPVGFPSPFEETRSATERTHRWAARCLRNHTKGDQALFAIVQGGLDGDLRRHSATTLAAMDFPGYAIGGLSLGAPKTETWRMVEATVAALPLEKPRYLMGVGSPLDLLDGVARGVDMFDSSFPTRIARNGALLTAEGRVNIKNARFRNQAGPIQVGCDCLACAEFSAAYVHHLFMSNELLSFQLATIHNLRFIVRLMEDVRSAIRDGRFDAFRHAFSAGHIETDPEVRTLQKAKWKAARAKTAAL